MSGSNWPWAFTWVQRSGHQAQPAPQLRTPLKSWRTGTPPTTYCSAADEPEVVDGGDSGHSGGARVGSEVGIDAGQVISTVPSVKWRRAPMAWSDSPSATGERTSVSRRVRLVAGARSRFISRSATVGARSRGGRNPLSLKGAAFHPSTEAGVQCGPGAVPLGHVLPSRSGPKLHTIPLSTGRSCKRCCPGLPSGGSNACTKGHPAPDSIGSSRTGGELRSEPSFQTVPVRRPHRLLNATCSVDGVIGAFAITNDSALMILDLGVDALHPAVPDRLPDPSGHPRRLPGAERTCFIGRERQGPASPVGDDPSEIASPERQDLRFPFAPGEGPTTPTSRHRSCNARSGGFHERSASSTSCALENRSSATGRS